MALYLAAGTTLVGTTFTEVVDANYARLPVIMTPVQQSASQILAGGTFPASATVTVNVIAEAVFDAPTGGNMLLVWQRTPSVLSPSSPITHPNPMTFGFPDARFPGASALTLWAAGSIIGTFASSTNGFSRQLLAGVTLALSNGAFSHFTVT